MTSIGHKALKQYLAATVDIAKVAAEKILSIYSLSFSVMNKEDGSPLTEADLVAHQIITDGLQKLTPHLPIVSEENSETVWLEPDTTFWLVDPLDGTKEFVEGNGEFTVNIALIEQCQPVLGVVHAPVFNTVYFAAKGCGAFKQTYDGKNIQKLDQNISDDSKHITRVVASRRHGSEAVHSIIDQLEPCELIHMGSSLKICLLAEGKADIYPRVAPTKEWDTAAAHMVLKETCGAIITKDNTELTYQKPGLLNPNFMAMRLKNNLYQILTF